jgi:hypothetical protein
MSKHIEKLIGEKSEYTEESIQKLFGKNWAKIMEDICAIGVFQERN